jgi:hypothetical protein
MNTTHLFYKHANTAYRQFFLLLGCLCFLSSVAHTQTSRFNLRKTGAVVMNNNRMWIGGANGLCIYNLENESVKHFELPERTAPAVCDVGMNGDWIWCVGDTGLWAIQTKLNDRLYFDERNGLPSGVINAIGFDEDYVWIATSNGAARFDGLIEQWELIDEKRGLPYKDISDMAVANKIVWLLSGNTLIEYNQQFEKSRTFAIDSQLINPSSLILLDDELWINGDNGMIRFQPQSQKQTAFFRAYLRADHIIEIFLESGRMWVIASDGIYYFEKQSGIWKDFEGNNGLAGLTIQQGEIGASKIWLLADQQILIWDRSTKNWSRLDYSSGLAEIPYSSIFTNGDLTLLISGGEMCCRSTSNAPWKRFDISSTSKDAGSIFSNLFDNEKGGYLEAFGVRWGWEGTRINFVGDYSKRFSDPSFPWQTNGAYRMDIKTQLDFSAGRRITGYYNNIDFSETMYSLRYRGNDNDLIREVTWGDFSLNQGNSPFAHNAQLFGTSVWLQYGEKTSQFKRSLVTLKAGAAEIRSRKTCEYYTGAQQKFQYSMDANSYLRSRFFTLPGASADTPPTGLKVYYDDELVNTNTANTLTNIFIGGIVGDYDELIPVEDFCFYAKASALLINRGIDPNNRLIAVYSVEGRNYQTALQDGNGGTTAKVNVYSLGGVGIIPASCSININYASGAAISLQSLGVDQDGNGIIDDEWIDYTNGFFFFPNDIPFPLDTINKQPYSLYTKKIIFKLQYETNRSMIKLNKWNLVRGSERLVIDDVPATAGNDYIIDYTYGTVVFVRDGIISRDTRIEIEYEYYQTADDLYTASVNFSPSDNFYTQVDWEKTSGSGVNNLSVFSESRISSGGYDIKIIPGAVFDPLDKRFSAGSFNAVMSSDKFRLQTEVAGYGESYNALYIPQSILGTVRAKGIVSASYDVNPYLRAQGNVNYIENRNAQHYTSTTAALLLHHDDLPAAQITFINSDKRDDSPEQKRFFTLAVDYSLPESIKERLAIKNLKFEHFTKYGSYEFMEDQSQLRYTIWNGFYKINANISDQFQTGISYRGNRVDNDTRGISSSERLLADLTYNEFRAAQFSITLDNNLDQDLHPSSDNANYYLRRFYQAGVRLLPGYWHSSLSPVFFEFTFNESLNLSGEADGSRGAYLWQFTSPAFGIERGGTTIRNYSMKNEYRGGSDFLLTSFFEYNTQKLSSSAAGINKYFFRWSEKADWKISFQTRIVPQYKYMYQDMGFARTSLINEPSLWIEHRWSPEVMQMTSFLYRHTNETTGNIDSRGNDYQAGVDLVYQKYNFAFLRYLEIRQSFNFSAYSSDGEISTHTRQYGSVTSVDIFPIHSMVLRFRMNYTKFGNVNNALYNYSLLQFNLRATVQF